MLLFSGIDLENIVYYKDCTHYFVMTAKKQSLLDKGVIINVSTSSWLLHPVFAWGPGLAAPASAGVGITLPETE